MSDPLRQVSNRKSAHFPYNGERPPSQHGRQAPHPSMDPKHIKGYGSEFVKSYLSVNPNVTEEYILESVSTDQLSAWLEKKKKREKRATAKYCLSTKAACIASRFSSTNISMVETQLLEQLSKPAEYLPLLYEFINIIAIALKADDCFLYAVKPGVKLLEISLYIHSEDGHYQLKPCGVAAEKSTVAAHVALRCKTVLVKNLAVESDRFPKGAGVSGMLTQSCLCLPVTTPTGDILCLMEFTRNHQRAHFDEPELQISTAIASLLGNVAYQCQINNMLQKQADLNDFLLEVSKVMFDDMIVIDKLVERIILFTKDLVQAERCTLFLIDKERGELYSDIMDEGDTDENGKTIFKKSEKEIRFAKDKGIAGHVAKTAEIINIPDAYCDERFNKEVDKETGYTTRNILCMPIVSKAEVIGVVQVINKRSQMTGFTKADEEAFKMFAVYCALALHYSKMYADVKLRSAQYAVAQEQVCYHAVCSEEEYRKLRSKPLLSKVPEDLDNYMFIGTDGKYVNVLPQLFIHMLVDLHGPNCFNMDKLCRFLMTMMKNYRPNAYHNWKHGWTVAHCMYCILKDIRHRKLLSDLEMKSLLVASLCHDVDHRGYNNAFFEKFNEPLATMYSSSVMEHHHFATTISLLQQANHNIFDDLCAEDYKKMLAYMKHAILSTDLSLSFAVQKKLAKQVVAGTLDLQDKTCMDDVIALMMTAVDLSAMCKPWQTQENAVYDIYEEFFYQGDLEKQLGSDPPPMMDRDHEDKLPRNQVGFSSFVCMPCYQTLADIFEETTPLVEGCKFNLEQWERIIEGKSIGLWEPGKSVVKVHRR